MNQSDAHPIVVIAEQDDGILHPATHELLAHARGIQRFAPGTLALVILGDSPKAAAEALARETGCDVWCLSSPGLARYNAEAFKQVLTPLLEELQPGYVCLAATSRGGDLAPGIAVRMKAACITQVIAVEGTADGISFTRAILGGKFHAEVRSLAGVTVVTFETGVMAPTIPHPNRKGNIVFKTPVVHTLNSRTLSRTAAPERDLKIADAKVVVAAGRGIGEQAHLDLVHQLAACLPQAVVCGSRPVVDMGWLPHSRQVGISGSTVSPELYVACGISGTAQHTAGMRGSAFIVSINRDPAAAIFQVSDVCVVEDLASFLPTLIETIKETGKRQAQ